MITRAAMDQHVSDGRAQRWTRELGPDRLVIQAAKLDGRWFIIPAGEEDFQEASADVAAELTAAVTVAAAFDGLIAGAGTEPERPEGAEGVAVARDVDTITRTEMTNLVEAGRGQQHRIADAVRLDGRWWTCGHDEVFRIASAMVDGELENLYRKMIASDEHVERARSAPSP
jgi:hypothetical protein